MNQEEIELRKELKLLRSTASQLQRLSVLEDFFSTNLMLQAEAIIEGSFYKTAGRLLVNALLACGDLASEAEICPKCGVTITKEEGVEQQIERAERILKDSFDPIAVIQEMTMPLVRIWLEAMERYMVEQGYRVPKWERPQWLREMEGKC